MKYTVLGFIALALAVAGCQPPPLQVDIDRLEFGMPPDSALVRSQVREYYELRLFDPVSALYKFSSPSPLWYITAADSLRSGWGVIVTMNAKNRMGGYVGWQESLAIFRNDQLRGINDAFSAKVREGHYWGWR